MASDGASAFASITPTHFGTFAAVVPPGWEVADDDDLVDIHAPASDAILQVSTYSAPHDATAGDLWDLVQDQVTRWNVTEGAIRRDRHGFTLDAQGPADELLMVMAARLWPGRLVFATFTYGPDETALVDEARVFLESMHPAPSKRWAGAKRVFRLRR